jgi:hypothetical protein
LTPWKRGNPRDLAVDRPLAHRHALVAAELLERQRVDHPLQRRVEPAARDILRHRQVGILLAIGVHLVLDVGPQLLRADLDLADRRHRVGLRAGAGAAAVLRDVARGEGQRDHHQRGKRHENADLGTGKAAEEGKHGVRSVSKKARLL